MAYKQNGINIFGTGGVETGKSKGKSLGADELQKKFGERIEVPISTPKNKQQDTLDGSMNFQEELSNKMNADSGYIAPVRALQSKKDGFEKARNRGNKAIAADGSFSSLGIATAQNILSGAKEGISKFKEKRAAKIAADPKRAKIKDLKSQLKEGRKLGRAEKKGNRQDKKIAKLEGKLGIAATPKTTPKTTPTERVRMQSQRKTISGGINTDGMATKLKTIGERKKPAPKSSGNKPKWTIPEDVNKGVNKGVKESTAAYKRDKNNVISGTKTTAVGSVGGPETTERSISSILNNIPLSKITGYITPQEEARKRNIKSLNKSGMNIPY